MKNIASYCLLVLTLFSCTVNAPYMSENLNELKALHKRVAILPFEVKFNDEYKNFNLNGNAVKTKGYWREQERLAGLDMQKTFFIAFAKQVEKGRYEKVIQNFSTSNKMLESSGVKIHEIPSYNKGELCKILGVDAVIWGQTSIEVKPMSYHSSSDGATTLAGLYDAFQGELIWQKEIFQSPSSNMDTPKSLGNDTVNQLIKLLPY